MGHFFLISKPDPTNPITRSDNTPTCRGGPREVFESARESRRFLFIYLFIWAYLCQKYCFSKMNLVLNFLVTIFGIFLFFLKWIWWLLVLGPTLIAHQPFTLIKSLVVTTTIARRYVEWWCDCDFEVVGFSDHYTRPETDPRFLKRCCTIFFNDFVY